MPMMEKKAAKILDKKSFGKEELLFRVNRRSEKTLQNKNLKQDIVIFEKKKLNDNNDPKV
jgi:hypothetical protein